MPSITRTAFICTFTLAVIANNVTADVFADVVDENHSDQSPETVLLVTFDGKDKSATHKWLEMNDPVMGGKSTGSFNITDGIAVFDGDVVNVPFLKAPGFIKSSTVDALGFPDVSKCTALVLKARAATPYAGYRFSFGNEHPSGGKNFAYGYKTHFNAPVGANFGEVTMPFTNFTDLWDDATGNAIKTCAEDKKYCPDAKALGNLETVSVWGEGVGGKVHLEMHSIWASGCK